MDVTVVSPTSVAVGLALPKKAKLRVGAAQSPAILGRSKQSDFEVPGQFASRQHARIEWHRDNFVLIDQSINRTYIRTDERTEIILERMEQYVLHGTGVISLGQSLYTAAGEVIHFRVEH